VVKLDHSLTHAAGTDPKGGRLLGAVLGVARAAELKAVAEGIETATQLEVVRDLGCDGGQGFLLAAPAPADELDAWLGARAGR
jgi:EAL domain-containing protein (putative c-di-GMP-specific phosphodiesterase class I)